MTEKVVGFSGRRSGPTPQDRAKLLEFVDMIKRLAGEDACNGVVVGVLRTDSELMVDWLTLPGCNKHEMLAAATLLQHNIAHNMLQEGIQGTPKDSSA